MVVPPALAAFSELEQVALQRARRLHRVMGEHGLDSLEATLELEEPPGGGGQRLLCEVQIAYGLVSVRILHTRVELSVEALHRPDLFDQADDGAFLPRRTDEPAATTAGAPVAGDARQITQANPPGGEGRAT
jgi:hypothetical protein